MSYLKYALAILLALCLGKAAEAKTTLSINFTHDNVTVNGRLQLPNGNGPYQVIIVAPGSGANDKDGTLAMSGGNTMCLYPGLNGQTLRPYLGLSEAFSDSGFAVLTYDKIEYTYPSPPAPITFHKLWLPVESAIKYLKTRSDIDTNNIVLLGHSEGSTLIPYIARSQKSISAMISLAGPRRPLDSILAYQLPYIATTCGGDVNAANQQAAQILAYFNDIRTGNWNSSTPPVFGVSAAVWSDYIKVADSVSINYNLANRQTLFVGLGDDINVPPAVELTRFQSEITLGSDFYLVPGINHYLTTVNDPSTSEVVTDTIVYWLRRHTFPASVPVVSDKSNSVSVFPCPAKDVVTIDYLLQHEGALLTVYNVYGVKLTEIKLDNRKGNKTVSIAALPAGVYTYVASDSGLVVKTGKLVVAK
ncbi:T9SS type A sorting domain-containing protein [Polluticoccus soli]|uniref:T9SS type A sorting domain-containing protein n=1 Tax=Polluticoccus soli TaxID=3034150 RepID=UPI0023E28CB5|nr:T9SS type A sorting domain-containing protein [Flavipsychrobacter sp. JY13-12]